MPRVFPGVSTSKTNASRRALPSVSVVSSPRKPPWSAVRNARQHTNANKRWARSSWESSSARSPLSRFFQPRIRGKSEFASRDRRTPLKTRYLSQSLGPWASDGQRVVRLWRRCESRFCEPSTNALGGGGGEQNLLSSKPRPCQAARRGRDGYVTPLQAPGLSLRSG